MKKLDKRPYFNIVDNLYLLTYQRINNSDTEIENLLDMNYVNEKLSPRELDSTPQNRNDDKYYNKRYLSSFVERHYRNMDFSEFKRFFDSLIGLCEDSIKKRNQLQEQMNK